PRHRPRFPGDGGSAGWRGSREDYLRGAAAAGVGAGSPAGAGEDHPAEGEPGDERGPPRPGWGLRAGGLGRVRRHAPQPTGRAQAHAEPAVERPLRCGWTVTVLARHDLWFDAARQEGSWLR